MDLEDALRQISKCVLNGTPSLPSPVILTPIFSFVNFDSFPETMNSFLLKKVFRFVSLMLEFSIPPTYSNFRSDKSGLEI